MLSARRGARGPAQEPADRPATGPGENQPPPGDKDPAARSGRVGQEHVHQADENHSRGRLHRAGPAGFPQHHLPQRPEGRQDLGRGQETAADPTREPRERGERFRRVELPPQRESDPRGVPPVRGAAESTVGGLGHPEHFQEEQ